MAAISECLVSFIIPMYNCEEYIGACIESILKISIKSYEIIVVDDGSTDSSYEICKKYADKYSFISLIKKENGGVSSARNQGIRMSKGLWVSFVDADDTIVPDFFDTLMNGTIKENTGVILGKFDYGNRKDSHSLGKCFEIDKLELIKMTLNKYYNKNLREYYYTSSCGKLYSRQIFIEHNICFPEDVFSSEDFLFNLNVFSKCVNVEARDVVGYRYRNNINSVTHTFNDRTTKNFIRVAELMQEYLNAEDMKCKQIYNEYLCRLLTNVQFSILNDKCHVKNYKDYKTRKQEFEKLLLVDVYAPILKNRVNYATFPISKKIIAYWIVRRNFFMVNFMVRFAMKLGVV